MRFIVHSALVGAAVFATSIQAKFSSPSKGASWKAGAIHEVEWDSKNLKGPVSMGLYSGSSVDNSAALVKIAVDIDNSGSYMWKPDRSIPPKSSYKLKMYDSRSTVVESDIFVIIDLSSNNDYESSYTNTSNFSNYTYSTSTSTASYTSTSTLVYSTSVYYATTSTSSIFTSSATAAVDVVEASVVVQIDSTGSYQSAYQTGYSSVAPPFAISNGSLFQVSGTASSLPATFTGAASCLNAGNLYAASAGALVGLLALVF